MWRTHNVRAALAPIYTDSTLDTIVRGAVADRIVRHDRRYPGTRVPEIARRRRTDWWLLFSSRQATALPGAPRA